MNETLGRFVARAAMDYIRNATQLDRDLCRELNQYPLIDHMRDLVEKNDIQKLLALACEDDDDIAGLAISLVKKLQAASEVKSTLLELWQQQDVSYMKKWWASFRLLEYADIPQEEIYTWVRDTWYSWLPPCISFFGGGDAVLDALEHRLAQPDPRDSKIWLRLCQAVGADDRRRARAIVSRYVESENALVSKVARDMQRWLG